MTLSEAIRLGSMMKPQGKLDMQSNGHTCTFGAALDAIGKLGNDESNNYKTVMDVWPLIEAHVKHPCRTASDEATATIEEIVWALNDRRGWSRERIADWVATIEQQLEAVKEPTCESALTVSP